MKEFAVRHPWITLFAVVEVCDCIIKLGKMVSLTITAKHLASIGLTLDDIDTDAEENKEETNNDEPAGDIQ